MSYKKKLYDNYVKYHTQQLYGLQSLERIRARFPVWSWYFKKLLPFEKESAILDIGCGTGEFVYYLQCGGYQKVGGVDVSPEQIDEGRRLGIEGLVCADIFDFLQNQQEQFDAIIARDVMEHFTKDEIFNMLALIKNALKPGGVFIMQSPNGEGMNYSVLYYGDFTHEVVFTRSSLSQIFRNNGFSDITFSPTGPVPYGVFSTIRWLIWQLLVLKARFYKAVETGDPRGVFTQNIIAKAIKA